MGGRELTIEAPSKCQAEIVLGREEKVDLPRADGPVSAGHFRYRLPEKPTTLSLKHT